MRHALLVLASFALACGGSSQPDAGTADTGVDSAVDCSTVGVGAPARCELGCTAMCGCGSCGEGEIWDFGGEHRICVGGCLALVMDAGMDGGAGDAGVDGGAGDAGVDGGVGDAGGDASADGGGADAGVRSFREIL